MPLTSKYVRKPFYIEAVQVTETNMEEVARWCNGHIVKPAEQPGSKTGAHVKVRVFHPLSERQTKAFVNDYVLYAGKGYKVYTQKAFENTFEDIFKNESEVADALRPLPAPPRSQKVHVRTEEQIAPGITATRIEDATITVDENPTTLFQRPDSEPIGKVTDIRESQEGLEFDFTVNNKDAAEAAIAVGAVPVEKPTDRCPACGTIRSDHDILSADHPFSN